jgi:hypothetical protein
MHRWLLAFCLLCSFSASAQKETPLAITHVTVIDCTGAPAKPDSTVVLAGHLISAVGPSETVPIPANARVIEANGKFLIPGLWDMHGHLTDATEDAFPLLIMNGVTGVRDMGGDLEQIDRWRAEIENGSRVGPHIIRAGPFVDGPKEGVSNRLTVRTPEEARKAVHDLKAKGVDFIKVHNALPPDAFFALMDEAHKEHIPVAVHLPKDVSSAEASDAGAASLEHVETMYESAMCAKGQPPRLWNKRKTRFLVLPGRNCFNASLRTEPGTCRLLSRTSEDSFSGATMRTHSSRACRSIKKTSRSSAGCTKPAFQSWPDPTFPIGGWCRASICTMN